MGTAGEVARNSFFNLVNFAVTIPLSFIISIILARGLGPEAYGTYAFYIWVISLCGYMVNLGLGSAAIKYISEYFGGGKREEAKGIIWMVFRGRLLVGLALSLAILLLAVPLSHILGKGHSPLFLVLVALAVVPYNLYYLLQSISAGLQKFEYWTIQALVTIPLRLVLAVLLLYLGFAAMGQLALDLFIWMVGLGVAIFLLNRFIPLRSLFRAPLTPEAFARARKYAVAMTGILLAHYLLWERPEVFLLGLFRPDEEVGFYSLAVKLPRFLMTLAPAGLAGVLLPTLSEQFGKGNLAKLKTVYTTSARYLMILALPLVAGGIALATPLVNVVYGAAYTPVIRTMAIVFLPAALLVFVTLCLHVLYAIDKPAYVLRVNLVLAPLNIGLNLLVIPRYGALGAAIVTSSLQLLIFPVNIWLVHRETGVLWPLADGARTAVAASLMGAALFLVYSLWGTIPALVLALPVGIPVYFLGLAVTRALRREDLDILAKVKEILPRRLAGPYQRVLGVMQGIVSAQSFLPSWITGSARKSQ